MRDLKNPQKNPVVLVSFWLVYCLVLLAWFSYSQALKGWLCLN
jgi:hypothetical protein